jgi:hypothetical protein
LFWQKDIKTIGQSYQKVNPQADSTPHTNTSLKLGVVEEKLLVILIRAAPKAFCA